MVDFAVDGFDILNGEIVSIGRSKPENPTYPSNQPVPLNPFYYRNKWKNLNEYKVAKADNNNNYKAIRGRS